MTYMTLLLSHFDRGSNLHLGVPLSYNYYLMQLQCPLLPQNGQTALIISSFNDHHKVVELLLGAGANPDLQDKVRTGRDSGVYSTLSNGDGTSCIL